MESSQPQLVNPKVLSPIKTDQPTPLTSEPVGLSTASEVDKTVASVGSETHEPPAIKIVVTPTPTAVKPAQEKVAEKAPEVAVVEKGKGSETVNVTVTATAPASVLSSEARGLTETETKPVPQKKDESILEIIDRKMCNFLTGSQNGGNSVSDDTEDYYKKYVKYKNKYLKARNSN